MTKQRKKYHIGLALSGGGAKGFGHLGALKALQTWGVKPDVVAGVSAGAIVAAFYADGMTPDDILKLFAGIKLGDMAEFAVPTDGFMKLDKMKKFLRKNLTAQRIEDLLTPTIITATNLDDYTEACFTSGPLADCVVASCSLPVIFKPARVDGKTYIDGGILHNLPSFCLRDLCDIVIGVNVSPLDKDTPFKSTIADIAYRSYRLMTTHNAIPDINLCDVIVKMDSVGRNGTFGIKKMKENVKEGYFTAMRAFTASPVMQGLKLESKS